MDKRVNTCGQENRDLLTQQRRLMDKTVETCGQKSGAMWIRELRIVDIFLLGIPTQYIVPIVANTLILVQCYINPNL